MPTLRAFRALRYDPMRVPDPGAVLCPPYDVISRAERDVLLARDEHNAVRLELPSALVASGPGEGSDVDAAYRDAARTLAEWRSDGTLRKDRVPHVYVHEMRTRVPGSTREEVARGFFCRLRLEAFGPGAGVRPHERTMSGPKEDRYRLLRATGVNFSPVVALHEGGADATAELLDRLTRREPDLCATTDDGVRQALWARPAQTADGADDPDVAALLELASRQPVTIADGHHRYETSLRYREERGQNRACESDPAWDYVLALLFEASQAPTVLPTHRVLRDGPRGEELIAAAQALFRIEQLPDAAALLAHMAVDAPDPRLAGGERGMGRFGLLTQDDAALLRVRPDRVEPLLDAAASEASRWLDVNVLAAALERLAGLDARSLTAGDRLSYTKDPAEVVAMIQDGSASSGWLMDPTPVASVVRVAEAGEVMPQKSTYFFPKAPSGLVFGPLEW